MNWINNNTTQIAMLAAQNDGYVVSYFSKQSDVVENVDEKEIQTTLDKHCITWSPEKRQNQSELLNLPDVLHIIMNCLAMTDIKLCLKDLKNCLYVCKSFNLLAKPIYVQKALSILNGDFNKIKVELDELTIQRTENGIVSFEIKSPNRPHFIKKTKELDLFKSYCAFLLNNTSSMEDRQSTKSILASVFRLHKACTKLLKKDEPKAKITSIFSTLFESN